MFMAGLEIDLSFLRHKGKDSVKVGVIAYIIPFLVIGGVADIVLELTTMQSLLFAIGLSASSVGIVYPVLRKAGILGPRRKLILSAVMITEFLSLTLLGIFFSTISVTVIVVLLFVVMVWLGWGYMHKRYKFLSDSTTENVAIKVILAVLLVSEFLASSSGLDVILIVFVMGVLLAKYVDEHKTLKEEIEAIGFGFLTPIFFFVIGYEISIVEFGQSFGTIMIFLTLSFLATYLATYIFSKKYFPKRAHIMGILFNAPMSIGIVTATIGLERGIIDHQLYLVLLGTVLLSSMIAVIFGKYPQKKPTA